MLSVFRNKPKPYTPKRYTPEELRQRYSRKLFNRGEYNPDLYYNKWGKPEEWADRIKRHCENDPNPSECSKNYGPLTSWEPIPDSESKDIDADETQRIIRNKLDRIKEAITLNLNEIITVRRLASEKGEVQPFSQETNEKINGLKDKLEGLKTQLSELDIVGNVSDLNKMAKIRGTLSDEVRFERDRANSEINKILEMYGGRKRKTKRIKRKKTKRRS